MCLIIIEILFEGKICCLMNKNRRNTINIVEDSAVSPF
jgi:hypothetical protein